MRKAKELRDMSVDELEAGLLDTKKELFELKNEFKQTKKIEKPHLLSARKKDIARILTILREKQTAK